MTHKNLKEAYYQPNYLWTGRKVVEDLYQIKSVKKKISSHGYQSKRFDKLI